jgi:hypothetical protein
MSSAAADGSSRPAITATGAGESPQANTGCPTDGQSRNTDLPAEPGPDPLDHLDIRPTLLGIHFERYMTQVRYSS